MSFQKAHQISNELGEVVVTSEEINLNSNAVTDLDVQAPYKNYRVLEVGFVVTQESSSQTTALQLKIGTARDDDGIVAETAALTLPANSFGTTFSTSSGAFDFVAAGVGVADSDGVLQIEAGDRLLFEVTAGAGTNTTAVPFARLAPNIEYKD